MARRQAPFYLYSSRLFPKIPAQSLFVFMFLIFSGWIQLDYMCSDDGDKEYVHYFKKEKRIWLDYLGWFYRFSLFPARGYNEKKTEAKIQAWLEKYGDGQ